jgi:multiple antibiotic resistance protein
MEGTAMTHWPDYARILIGLLAITNAFGAVPIFISLTDGLRGDQRRHVANVTALTVGIVLAVSALCGELILHFFGISIAAFRTAGGLLILLLGIAMLHVYQSRATHTPEEADEARERETMAVVPLGIPLIGGPGAISAMIIYAHHGSTMVYTGFLVIASIVVAAVIAVVLRLAEPISRLLGTTGLNIATRLMGLVLTAIAVQFIFDGLTAAFPALGG